MADGPRPSEEKFKTVIVGDRGVGKTALSITVNTKNYPDEYIPIVQDFSQEITIDGRECYLSYFDTGGGEDYARLRPLGYPDTDVFLLCVDICSRNSFDNIETDWLPELRHFNPDTPIVLVGNKSDLRDERKTDDYEMLYSASYWKEFVREAEGEALVKKHNLYSYLECSALRQIGLEDVVTTIVHAARENATRNKTLNWLQQRRQDNSLERIHHDWWKIQNLIMKPPTPPEDPDVQVEPKTSTFPEELGKLYQESSCADVQFILPYCSPDKNRPLDDIQSPISSLSLDKPLDTSDSSDVCQSLSAHQVILSAASPVLYEMLSSEEKIPCNANKYHEIFDDIKWESNSTGMVAITLNKSISTKAFKIILQFLYTGMPDLSDQGSVLEIKSLADAFKLSSLVQMCLNVLQEEESLNPSIASWVNDKTGTNLKDMFLNKPVLSDITFSVEGHVIQAHKAVLMARCDVMAAMFGGAFREGNTIEEIPIPDVKLGPFLALLEYLYSDHVTFLQADPKDILVLADRYFIPRLVTLCELEILRRLKEEITKDDDVTKNVIQLLLWSQTYNASQLHNWCLHYVTRHYEKFEATEDFRLVEGENKDFVMKNQWRTVEYSKRVKEYEEANRKYNKTKREYEKAKSEYEKHRDGRSSIKCTVM